MIEPIFLKTSDGHEVAVKARPGTGAGPGLIWLGGFNSAMDGTKAEALDRWASQTGLAFLRFDYSGHGLSPGRLEDGSIGRWLDEALCVLARHALGPQILIGSSMGGWIALLMTRALLAAGKAGDIRALVLIAPAVDMTEALMWQRFSDDIRREITETGIYLRPSRYDDGPYPISRTLIEEGRNHLLLGSRFNPGCPVRILHGIEDPDVPFEHSHKVIEMLDTADIRLIAVKDGDHRLSRPQDIALLIDTVAALAHCGC